MSYPKRAQNVFFIALLMLLATASWAQTYNSGSDGSDGALVLDTAGTVVFDPAALGLDADGDGVYHFTTITIDYSTTVRLGADVLGTRPVVWLASGDVTINGTLDLNGQDGHFYGSPPLAAVAGAGGFAGGVGRTATSGATPGEGPGGGSVGADSNGGGHAGHAVAGARGVDFNVGGGGAGGTAYGNLFLMPLVGGSGGAGGGGAAGVEGGGGGAGGGAILIASSTRITLDGGIEARGGWWGSGSVTYAQGGSGSGGSVRLVAPILDGFGWIDVDNGTNLGSVGRVRLEAFQKLFGGTANGDTRFATPGPVFPPANAPSVRIATVDGVPAPAAPSGGYAPADVVINASGPVTLGIEASNVPLGTVVHLVLTAESQERVEVDSTPLAGTLAASTATATLTIPSGFSRFTVQASWTP